MSFVIQDQGLAHIVHYVLEWLALAAGGMVYRKLRAQKGVQSLLHGSAYPVLLGCLLGAAIGNKTVYWIENPQLWAQAQGSAALWLQGQSLVGGLLGGWIGVELCKWLWQIEGPRTGDDFVPAILCGILVGRVGCFLAGLNDGTYGLATTLPWGMDLGDGILRHPAPLYEWLIALGAYLTWPQWQRALQHTPGLAFRHFMLAYMLWRLAADTLKPVPYVYWGGLSGIQWVCLVASCAIAMGLWADKRRKAR